MPTKFSVRGYLDPKFELAQQVLTALENEKPEGRNSILSQVEFEADIEAMEEKDYTFWLEGIKEVRV